MNVSERVQRFHDVIRLEKEEEQRRKEDEDIQKRLDFLKLEEKAREEAITKIKEILDDSDSELDTPNVYKVILSEPFKDKWPYNTYSYLVVMTERIRKVAEAIQYYDSYEQRRETIHYCNSLINYIIGGSELNEDRYPWYFDEFRKVDFVPCDITKCSPDELKKLEKFKEEHKEQIDKANNIIYIINNSPEKELSKRYMISIFADFREGDGWGRRVYRIPTTAKGAELLRVFQYMRDRTKIEPLELPDKVIYSIKKIIDGVSR